jgi:TonB family protein
MIKFVQPDYPADYRARHTEGTGLFRIMLNVNTGSATNVAVVKSTGFSGLDDSAIRAIHQWHWQPRRWKEIDMPVTFTMRRREPSYGSERELAIRGLAHYRKGDNDSAIKVLDEAIRLQPTLAILYIDRGARLSEQGRAR